MPALSLLIIDSSRVFSTAAQTYLLSRSEVKAVELASEADCALRIAGLLKPDFILVDIKVLTGGGENLCLKLKREAPSAVVIVLTLFGGSQQYPGFPEAEHISGFIPKESFAETILPLLRACCRSKLTAAAL